MGNFVNYMYFFHSLRLDRSFVSCFVFNLQVRPLLEEPIALAAYEQRDGQIGFMLNPIGKTYKQSPIMTRAKHQSTLQCVEFLTKYPEVSKK